MFEATVKRCPFCGSPSELIETDRVSVVRCTNCGAEGRRVTENWGRAARSAYAVVSWNLREPEPSAGREPPRSVIPPRERIRVSDLARRAPDTAIINTVTERTSTLDYTTRCYIQELIYRFRRNDALLMGIYADFVPFEQGPSEPPESR